VQEERDGRAVIVHIIKPGRDAECFLRCPQETNCSQRTEFTGQGDRDHSTPDRANNPLTLRMALLLHRGTSLLL
jgi:hypothetical protein